MNAHHPAGDEGGSGGGSGGIAGGVLRGTPQPMTAGHPTRAGAGRLRPREPPSVLVGRVQNHLHEMACLFSSYSERRKR